RCWWWLRNRHGEHQQYHAEQDGISADQQHERQRASSRCQDKQNAKEHGQLSAADQTPLVERRNRTAAITSSTPVRMAQTAMTYNNAWAVSPGRRNAASPARIPTTASTPMARRWSVAPRTAARMPRTPSTRA